METAALRLQLKAQQTPSRWWILIDRVADGLGVTDTDELPAPVVLAHQCRTGTRIGWDMKGVQPRDTVFFADDRPYHTKQRVYFFDFGHARGELAGGNTADVMREFFVHVGRRRVQ